MARIEKTVFISYRRTNYWTALAVYQHLHSNGYDVFFDYKSIPSGDFAQAITENIISRAHFVLLLSSSALERCHEPGDWLRREIETAIDYQRNIIPLVMEGFEFGSQTTMNALTGKLLAVKNYNAIGIPVEYFEDAMNKLRSDRFLNRELESVSHPVSEITKQITEEQIVAANKAEPVKEKQLTAQEWFERGYKFAVESKNYEEALRCFSKAAELAPDEAAVQNNIGLTLQYLNRYDKAESAYRKAIELNPAYDTAYSNLGSLLDDLKRYDEAETAYDKAIELNPAYDKAYSNLGKLLRDLKRYDEAESAYRTAIELNPALIEAYNGLVLLLRATNKLNETFPLLEKMLEIYPQDFNAYLALASINKQVGKEISKKHIDKARQFIPEDDLYNRACLESVCDNFDKAFEYLAKAAQRERFNPAWAWEDLDLQWIRNDPRFVKIVGEKPSPTRPSDTLPKSS